MDRPTWTANEARLLRRRDSARRARLHALLGRWLDPFVRVGIRMLAVVAGDRAYHPGLTRVSRRMNRHQRTAFRDYDPGSQDIICSAYFKAGTNWVMHICYQIAHLGEGRFDHIQDEIAWPDAAEPRYWRALNDSNADAAPTGYPVIKSHLPADLIPLNTDAKYIVVIRDPLDCAASGYHYFTKLFFGPTTPPPDIWLDFFASDVAVCGPWHHFTASWWVQRHRSNVLFLRFEDMKRDPAACIAEIAAFLGIAMTNDQQDRVLQNTSFETMRAMNDKFYPVRQSIWSTPGGDIIRKGAVGDGRQLFSGQAIARFRGRTTRGLARNHCDIPHYDLLSTLSETPP